MKSALKEFSAPEFIAEFQGKHTAQPVYTLIGADMFYMGKVLQMMVNNWVDPASRDFDYVQVYGDEVKNDSFMEQLDMLPFMASKRVIILRDIDDIEAKHLQRLPLYLKNPSPDVILILTTEKIDARTTLGKEIVQNSIRIICKEPSYSNDIRNWLNEELKRRKLRIDASAREFFIETVQMDYCAALNELEKVILYMDGESENITLEHVRNALGVARSNTIFELQDSLGLKNCVQSLNMVESMLQNDMEPIFIVHMLNTFFQRLWKILFLLKRNMSQNEITQRYLNEVHTNFREKVVRFARNYSLKQLRFIFDLLLEADTDLKSSGMKKNLVLDLLIYKICNITDRG